jgi:cyclic pyranopterin phosphate synthase
VAIAYDLGVDPVPPFTHLDARGRARMVDTSAKEPTHRRALAEAFVRLRPETLRRLAEGSLAKGDAWAVARVAGIQGAKRAADLVPLCHPLRLDLVQVDLDAEGDGVRVSVEARAFDRTGVEMEALCGAAAAALALYDLVKAVDRGASVERLRLLEKEGGRSGPWRREEDQ